MCLPLSSIVSFDNLKLRETTALSDWAIEGIMQVQITVLWAFIAITCFIDLELMFCYNKDTFLNDFICIIVPDNCVIQFSMGQLALFQFLGNCERPHSPEYSVIQSRDTSRCVWNILLAMLSAGSEFRWIRSHYVYRI